MRMSNGEKAIFAATFSRVLVDFAQYQKGTITPQNIGQAALMGANAVNGLRDLEANIDEAVAGMVVAGVNADHADDMREMVRDVTGSADAAFAAIGAGGVSRPRPGPSLVRPDPSTPGEALVQSIAEERAIAAAAAVAPAVGTDPIAPPMDCSIVGIADPPVPS